MSSHQNADLVTSLHPSHPHVCSPGVTFFTSYDASHGHDTACSKEQWALIQPNFLEAMAPLTALTPRGIRRYATAYVKLCAWALNGGLELNTEWLLSAEVIEAYLATQKVGQADQRQILRRLAARHGIADISRGQGFTKRGAPVPYSEAEGEALWNYASALSNQNRATSVKALLVLGMGCGLARTGLRGVTAECVHQHGDDTYVRSGQHCAKVRAAFVERLDEICRSRQSGDLIGTPKRNITTEMVEWTLGKVGVPRLNTDRLRSTYICRSIEAGESVLDVLMWTGMRNLESLGKYLGHLAPAPSTCPLLADQGGAL